MGRIPKLWPWSDGEEATWVMPRSWVYPENNVVSSEAFKQMNDMSRFLFSKDDPSSSVGNESEGEGAEVLGGSGIWGRDYVCRPSHLILNYGKEILCLYSVSGLSPLIPEGWFFRAEHLAEPQLRADVLLSSPEAYLSCTCVSLAGPTVSIWAEK